MSFPKLKNPVFCRVLSYIVVIFGSFIPSIIAFNLNVPEEIKGVSILVSLIILVVYIMKNFVVLMMLDMALATYACYKDARKQYVLPHKVTKEKICRRVLRYGTKCEATYKNPEPIALRYKFSSPVTIYNSGIERVIAVYETDFLDRETYSSIISSAKRNSVALRGKKKARWLDKEQKKAPLNRATVVVIFAQNVDFQLSNSLYSTVCGNCGNEEKDCVIPCVINLSDRTCVFNSVRVGYVGFTYAVKNRGISFIKKYVFGGNMNLKDNRNYVECELEIDPEETLWDLWKRMNNMVKDDKEEKQMFEHLADKEIRIDDGFLILKWGQRGIMQMMKIDEANKNIVVSVLDYWSYPKVQPIGKQTRKQIEEHIVSYYANKGYSVIFSDEYIFDD
jgi:hypothetical protein